MNLYFFTEARFDRVNGSIWTTPGFSMILWQRYIEKFEHVFVVARVNEANVHSKDNISELLSDRVTVIDLPYYIGMMGYLKKKKAIKKVISSLAHHGDAFLCRVPGNIGAIAAKVLNKKNIPYSLEVVGEPWESMSKEAYGSVWSPLLQRISRRQLRHIVKKASAALYVTEYTLQKKYPVSGGVFTTGASNVVLKDDCYSLQPRQICVNMKDRPAKLLSVGTLAQLYKAPDVVIKAIALLKHKGYNVKLTWYGDGQYCEPMKKMALELGVYDCVIFAGAVSQSIIRKEFENTDLFVHASRAEGLPRAVIEAMAFGLPCIGSSVAGIPELLDREAIVRPNDAKGLADKIVYFLDDSDYMQQQAERNWKEAKKYHNDILSARRKMFFDEIIKVSQI